MATKNQNQDNEPVVKVETQQIRRITVGEISYETSSSTTGEEHIFVKGDGITERELKPEDVDQLSRFFGRVVRYNANQKRIGSQGAATDGRGQVTHPNTDARLKGNEDLRQGDPGGEKRAGRA